MTGREQRERGGGKGDWKGRGRAVTGSGPVNLHCGGDPSIEDITLEGLWKPDWERYSGQAES